MADSKISALTLVSSIDGTQGFAVNDGGTTRKATGAQQAAYQETRLQQGVLCSMAGDQAITTATWEELAFDTESWKVGDSAIHSTSSNNTRLTAQIAGEYFIVGAVQWEAIANSHVVQTRLYKNGASIPWRHTGASLNDATYSRISPIAAILRLAVDDYLELSAFHTRGSDVDVLSTNTNFGMYLLGR